LARELDGRHSTHPALRRLAGRLALLIRLKAAAWQGQHPWGPYRKIFALADEHIRLNGVGVHLPRV